MTSLHFQERAQKIKEIYDCNDRHIPDVLTILGLLNNTPKSCQVGFYRGAYRQVVEQNFYSSDPPKRISIKS